MPQRGGSRRAGSAPLAVADAAPEPPVDGRRAYAALLVLLAAYVLNEADRWMLPVLLPAGMQCPMPGANRTAPGPTPAGDDCIVLTEVQVGFLTGPAFTAVYVVAGLPLARLADRFSRRWLFLASLLTWSGITVASAFVRVFWQLAVVRVGLGIGEAACNPASYSLMGDMFSAGTLASAMAVYHAGVYIGSSLSYMSGVISASLGWRASFLCLGLPGFAVAILVPLVVYEPTRGRTKGLRSTDIAPAEPQHSLRATALHLWRRRDYVWLCVASSARNVAGYALGAWLPTFYARTFGVAPATYGTALAIIVPLAGASGSYFGGWLCDRIQARRPGTTPYAMAVMQVIAAPCLVLALLAEDFERSLVCFVFAYFFAETWLGPAAALVVECARPTMRGTAAAVYLLVNTMIGGLGPLLIGALLGPNGNDGPVGSRFGYTNGVRYALVIVVPTCYALSAALFALVGLYTRRYARSSETQLSTAPPGEQEEKMRLVMTSESPL